jgi:hypothetical protein
MTNDKHHLITRRGCHFVNFPDIKSTYLIPLNRNTAIGKNMRENRLEPFRKQSPLR